MGVETHLLKIFPGWVKIIFAMFSRPPQEVSLVAIISWIDTFINSQMSKIIDFLWSRCLRKNLKKSFTTSKRTKVSALMVVQLILSQSYIKSEGVISIRLLSTIDNLGGCMILAIPLLLVLFLSLNPPTL